MVAGEGFSQHWRLTDGCIGAHGCGQQIEASFIYEDQRALFGLSFFSRLRLVYRARPQRQPPCAGALDGWGVADCNEYA
jgi:hypothetical protein